jgi:M6 family metalloprotease-like protein
MVRAGRIAAAVLTVALWTGGGSAASLAAPAGERESDIAGGPPPIVQGEPDAGRGAGPLPCGLAGPLNDGGLYTSGAGFFRVAMIFVDFSDVPATPEWTPQELFDGYVPPSEVALRELSSGRFGVDVRGGTEWVRMPKPLRAYDFDADGDGEYDDHNAYIRDAVRAADPSFDFSGFDAVYVVSTPGANTPTATNSGELPGSEFAADGAAMPYGVTIASTDPYDRDFAGFVHETLHLLGLPDLYGDSDYAGPWDVMHDAEGPRTPMTAWTRFLAGWLEKRDFRCLSKSANKTLTAVTGEGGLKALVVKTGATGAFVIEARAGERIGRCRRDGVLVYRVSTRDPSGEGILRVIDSKPRTRGCDGHANATFIPRGDAGVYRSAGRRFTLRVLRKTDAGYRVAVRIRR